MIPSTEGWLPRHGADIHYVEWSGAGASPAILLLHGLGSNARYWDRVADHVRDRRVVALDLTPDDTDRASMAEILLNIDFAMREVHLDRPIVVGHSWGAALGLELVARHPAVASGFVFVDGPVMGVAPIFSWEEVEARMQPDLPRYASPAEAIAHTRAQLGAAWADDLEPFVEGGLTREGDWLVPKLSVPVRHRILRDLYYSNAEELWRSLAIPAAALIARKSDAKISRSTDTGMQRLSEIAPAVELERFDTPHDIPLYAPAGVAEKIERIARRAEVVTA